MTVVQLEAFVAVAQVGHFRKAAERLDKTQPALSLHIQKLEAQLGVTLFDRIRGRIGLTAAGKALLPHAEKILSSSSALRLRMDEVRQGKTGRIRVGVLPTVAAHFLPPILVRFQEQYPNVEILLREQRRSRDLIPLLISGEVDLCFGLEPKRLAGLKCFHLLTEELCVAVSVNHPFSRRRIIRMKELENQNLITYDAADHDTQEKAFRAFWKAGFEPKVSFASSQAETIQHLVAANLGVAILPEMVLRHGKEIGLAMVRLRDPTLTRSIVALRAAKHASLPATRLIGMSEEVGHRWNGIKKNGRSNRNGC